MGSILLVESDVITSDAWASAVTASGHAALTASGMRSALALIREGGVDLVVVDVYDPRAGVIELARGMDALPDAPPIVVVSSSPAAPQISVRIGAALFLPKPCEPGELAAAVAQLFERLHPVRGIDDERTTRTRRLG